MATCGLTAGESQQELCSSSRCQVDRRVEGHEVAAAMWRRSHVLLLLLPASAGGMEVEERRRLRDEVKIMFTHAYDNYMANAFPADVLLPLTCKPADDWGGMSLTLLDTLDTLAIMGNATEFERGVRYATSGQLSFDIDETVSLFETNIRALGGLLSAHAFAADPALGLLAEPYPEAYHGGLLPLALDLGERLLPALHTPSGIPYGSINLRHGVAHNESTVTCTAAAGTLVLEFGALSRLTGDPKCARRHSHPPNTHCKQHPPSASTQHTAASTQHHAAGASVHGQHAHARRIHQVWVRPVLLQIRARGAARGLGHVAPALRD